MADKPEVTQIPLGRRLVAEVIGTMALVFVAVGADAAAAVTGGAVGTAARAVAPAMMVAALIYAIGDVSGAHFNPVVTTAFAMKRLFPPRLVPAYWLAQLVGAVRARSWSASSWGRPWRLAYPRSTSRPCRRWGSRSC